MWQLALLALAPTVVPPSGGTVVEGEAFGPRQKLTCTWFTNFENSRFEQCRAMAGNLLPSGNWASVKCLGRTCEQLDAEARRVARWQKPEPVWGTFTVQLVGRISLHEHKRRYLGDGTSTVLVEELLSVRKLK